jgi:N-acetylglutamate synthase
MNDGMLDSQIKDDQSLMGNLAIDIIAKLERLAMHAWPAIEVVELDGWLLRYAAGITRRANSVWPNEVRGVPALEENLERVETFYAQRGLPARFQICPAMQPAELDGFLAQRGYRAVAKTAVQISELAEMLAHTDGTEAMKGQLTVEVTPLPEPIWWECYAKADEVAPESIEGRKAICAQINQSAAYAVVYRSGEAIAVGSAAAEAEWVGFYNVATLASHRRMGAAQMVMQALGQWGKMQGATRAYLQVMVNNEAAQRLYARLGFVTGYHYIYREQITI